MKRLGAVLLVCGLLAGCSPGEYKGRVIVGLDDKGVPVGVFGFCNTGKPAEIKIYERVAEHEFGASSVATKFNSDKTVRVELRRDAAPEGWASEAWRLPEEGTIVIFGTVFKGPDSGVASQRLETAEIDISAPPPLPKHPELKAMHRC